MPDYPALKIPGRGVLNENFQPEAPAFRRLVEDCPNCSSTNTKPLSYNANTFPHSVYECRRCAHVWRFLQTDIAHPKQLNSSARPVRRVREAEWVTAPNAVGLASMFPLLPRTCPQCLQVKGILQEKVRDLVHRVDYYRCGDCQYIWAIDKSEDPQLRPPTIVRRN